MSERQLYTSSRLRILRECLRKHYYKYALLLRTHETAEMRFGTIGHRALEAWYRAWQAGDLDARLTAALAILDEISDPFDRAKLRLLVIAYHERWHAEPWDVLAVEQEFRYELGDHLIGGKIDVIIRDRRDGRDYVVEHKFTGSDTSIGGPYWERLTIDTQVSIYIDGAGVLGYDVAGCIYDVAKRPEHEQKMATPLDARRYTVGKGCKHCGGRAGGKDGPMQGRGHLNVVFASEVKQSKCDECKGTGWKEAPHLHANQRDADETVEEFEERLLEVIAERPDDFLQRGPVVRLADELPAMRTALVEWISVAELGVHPPNDSACVRAGRICDFFPICAGRASIDDYPRTASAHPELEAA